MHLFGVISKWDDNIVYPSRVTADTDTAVLHIGPLQRVLTE